MASRGVPDALAQERHPDRQRDVGEIACATDVAALVFVGSWICKPDLSSRRAYAAYVRNAWPGTAVLIDTDEAQPRLLRLLEHLNLSEPPAEKLKILTSLGAPQPPAQIAANGRGRREPPSLPHSWRPSAEQGAAGL